MKNTLNLVTRAYVCMNVVRKSERKTIILCVRETIFISTYRIFKNKCSSQIQSFCTNNASALFILIQFIHKKGTIHNSFSKFNTITPINSSDWYDPGHLKLFNLVKIIPMRLVSSMSYNNVKCKVNPDDRGFSILSKQWTTKEGNLQQHQTQ